MTGNRPRVFDGVSIDNPHRWWDPIRGRAIALGKLRGVVVEHFTRHDLRRTAATGMTRLGARRFIADRVIGHKEGSEMMTPSLLPLSVSDSRPNRLGTTSLIPVHMLRQGNE